MRMQQMLSGIDFSLKLLKCFVHEMVLDVSVPWENEKKLENIIIAFRSIAYLICRII